MVYVENLLSILKKKKINFFSGVPDSVLKNLSLKIRPECSKGASVSDLVRQNP